MVQIRRVVGYVGWLDVQCRVLDGTNKEGSRVNVGGYNEGG